jgi:HEAT repeat protein
MKALPRVVLALGALHLAGSVRAEPVVDGYPLSSWVSELRDRDASEEIVAAVFHRLMKFGPSAAPAVPALIERLTDRARDNGEDPVDVLVEIGAASVEPLARALEDESPRRRARAAVALGRIGPAAKAAAPALTAALEDCAAEVRVAAAEALWLAAGDAAGVPVLAEGLTAADVDVRRRCAACLGQIGRAARAAVPALVAALAEHQVPREARDRDRSVAVLAAAALGRIGTDARTVVPALKACLGRTPEDKGNDDNARRERVELTRLRFQAAVALLRFGEETKAATTVLSVQLQFPSSARPGDFGPPLSLSDFGPPLSVSDYEAAVALLGRHESAMVPWASKALDDERDAVRGAATHLFLEFGTVPGDVRPRLRQLAAKDECLAVRRLALLALVRAGDRLDEAGAEVLCKAAWEHGRHHPAHPAEQLNWNREVVRVLSRSETAVRVLGRLLDKDMSEVGAAALLAQLGPAARPALPALRGLLTTGADDHYTARLWAAVALVNLGDPVPEAATVFADALIRLHLATVVSTMPPHRLTSDQEFAEYQARRALDAAVKRLPARERAEVVSAIVKLLDDNYNHAPAADVLVQFHRARTAAVIEPLTDVLRAGREIGKERAARVLGRIGRDADAALPPLWEMLGDSDPKLRAIAAVAVWQIEGRTEAVESVLRKGLQSDRDEEQSVTLAALRDLAPAGVELLPDVVAVWKQDSGRLDTEATEVFYRLVPDVLPALLDLLSHPHRAVRTKAAHLLAKHGPAATEPLIRALARLDGEPRLAAVAVLEHSRRRARAAVPALRPLLKHGDERLRFAAALALWRIAGETKETLPIVLDALRRPDVSDRRRAAEVLGEFAAEGTAPALTLALWDDDKAVRCAAAVSLALVPGGRGALPSLIRVVSRDTDSAVRHAALRTVRDLARDAESARTIVPALTAALNDDDPDVRLRTMEALIEVSDLGLPPPAVLVEFLDDPAVCNTAWRLLGLHTRAAVPYLSAALTHPRPPVRHAAARLLRELGANSDAREAVPELICALQAKDELCVHAAAALGAIGPAAREAIPALQAACRDGGPGLSRAAREALRYIGGEPESPRGRF